MSHPYVPRHYEPYHPMIGCQLKMARAQKHFEELQNAAKTFIEGNPYTVVNEDDAEPHHYVARLKTVREPPPELSPIIGDIVHNGRSALDHLAWLLVKKAGNRPELGRPQFPIFTKDPFDRTLYANTKKWKDALGRWNRHTWGMAPDDVAILKRLQPYKRAEPPDADPLARLAELSNWDKHRELHFVGQLGVGTGISIENLSPNVIFRPLWFLPARQVLEDGAVVARYESRATREGEPEANVKLRIAFDIAFGEGSPLEGLGVEDALQEIGVHASDVLLTFKHRFEGKL
jgi:hypothetical protein